MKTEVLIYEALRRNLTDRPSNNLLRLSTREGTGPIGRARSS